MGAHVNALPENKLTPIRTCNGPIVGDACYHMEAARFGHFFLVIPG